MQNMFGDRNMNFYGGPGVKSHCAGDANSSPFHRKFAKKVLKQLETMNDFEIISTEIL